MRAFIAAILHHTGRCPGGLCPGIIASLCMIWALGGTAAVLAQNPAAAPAPAAADKSFEKVELETSDGVALSVSYYKSDKGKQAGVILFIHHDKGNKQDYDGVARAFQRAGYAVVVPDLRGYGESNKRLVKETVAGELKVTDTKPVEAKKKQDYEDMIKIDLERIKTFLLQRHNKGEFNIRKLGVVGVEMGTVLTLHWSLFIDWAWENLTTGPQGKDVRGIVLITPRWNHKGIIINPAFEQKEFIPQIPFLIMVGGKDLAAQRDAKRVNDQLLRHHPEPSAEEAAEKKKLFFFEFDTTLQGYKLLTAGQLKVLNGPAAGQAYDPLGVIQAFLDNRVKGNEEEWVERSLP
ncbi:MAG: hypothetical protein SFX18_15495 [Pirellulales bacterium]|nr:hypothetical protein [Pirellulales bacterium]